MKGAENDYNKSLALAKQRIKTHISDDNESDVPDLIVGSQMGAMEVQRTGKLLPPGSHHC